jgi:DNA polymerase-3 subunit chi
VSTPEFWFYHLERQPLQVVLPVLLEKTLSRGWRACLRFSSHERLDSMDSALWTYSDDAFLPHGTARDGFPERQPVFLTLAKDNPNDAQVLFLLELAEEHDPARFIRIVRLFDDTDENAKAQARGEWSAAKELGFDVSYWRQDSRGSWTKHR